MPDDRAAPAMMAEPLTMDAAALTELEPSASGGWRRMWAWAREVPTTLAVGLLVVFAALHFFAYPGRLSSHPYFTSPHENVRYQLAEQWLDTGKPAYPLPAEEQLPDDIAVALTPRDSVVVDDEVVPKDFAYALALVTGLRAVDDRLPLALTTISAVALLIVTWFLAREVGSSRRVALLATALFGASTAFFAAGWGMLETGATTAALFLLGVLALVRRRRRARANEGTWNGVGLDVVAGACFAAAIGTHHAIVLLVAGTCLVFARRVDGGSARRLLALAATGFIGTVPILLFNQWIFGSPFTDGYSFESESLPAGSESTSVGLLSIRPSLLVEQLVRYFARPEALALLALAGVGWWVIGRRRDGNVLSTLGLAALLGGVPFVVLAGARPLNGSNTFLVNSSLMRYLAPVVALVAVAAAVGVAERFRARPKMIGLAVVVAIGWGLVVNVGGTQGPLNILDNVPYDTAHRDAVLEVIPTDAFVITGRADKALWPERQTLAAQFLVNTPPLPGEDAHPHRRYPSADRVADVVSRLVLDGHHVYLWNDGEWLGPPDGASLHRLDGLLKIARIERGSTGLQQLWEFVPAGG